MRERHTCKSFGWRLSWGSWRREGRGSGKAGTGLRVSSPSYYWLTCKEQLMKTRSMVWAQLWPPAGWDIRHYGVSVSSCAFRVAWLAAEQASAFMRYVHDGTSFSNLTTTYREEWGPALCWWTFMVNAIWKRYKATQHHEVKILPGGLKLILYTWTQRSNLLHVTSGMWHCSSWKPWLHRIYTVKFRGQTDSEMSSKSVDRERLNKAQENMGFVLCFKFCILRLVSAELTFDFLVGVRHCSGLCKE